MYTIKVCSQAKELTAIIALRYKILRQPWNQPAETATDTLEERSINAYIEDENGNLIACARLQENENKTGQIRFMAVDHAFQGKGLGHHLLSFLEQKAKDLNLVKIELQARENAVKFYEANDYVIREKTFLLWGIIQHYLMEKNI